MLPGTSAQPAPRSLLVLTALLALAPVALAGAPGAIGDCFVTNDIDNQCRQYDGPTGSLVGPYFANAGAVGSSDDGYEGYEVPDDLMW